MYSYFLPMFIIAAYISTFHVSYIPWLTVHPYIYATLLFRLFQNDLTIPCYHLFLQNEFHLKHLIRGKLKAKKSKVLEKMQFLLTLDHLYCHLQKQWLVTAKSGAIHSWECLPFMKLLIKILNICFLSSRHS